MIPIACVVRFPCLNRFRKGTRSALHNFSWGSHTPPIPGSASPANQASEPPHMHFEGDLPQRTLQRLTRRAKVS